MSVFFEFQNKGLLEAFIRSAKVKLGNPVESYLREAWLIAIPEFLKADPPRGAVVLYGTPEEYLLAPLDDIEDQEELRFQQDLLDKLKEKAVTRIEGGRPDSFQIPPEQPTTPPTLQDQVTALSRRVAELETLILQPVIEPDPQPVLRRQR